MKDEIFEVGQDYRTNSLSFQEGGSYVEVKFTSGHNFGYDNVHYPKHYVTAICNKHIEYGKVVRVKVDGRTINF